MFGGGRYDGLVGLFNVDPVPTVGFGMGDVTIRNFLDGHNLLPNLETETDLYVVLVGDIYELSIPIVSKIRQASFNVAVDSSSVKLDKQLKTAYKKNIRYAMFIGKSDIEEGKYKIRNLRTNEEKTYDIDGVKLLLETSRNLSSSQK